MPGSTTQYATPDRGIYRHVWGTKPKLPVTHLAGGFAVFEAAFVFGHHFAKNRLRQLGDVGRDPAHLLVLRVAFRVFVGDYRRRSRPRVQIAKAAIAGKYITQMVARLECGVLAVPVHSARSDINYRAPRGIAKGMAWRSSKRRRRCKSSDTKREVREAFQHNEALLVFHILSS